MYHLAVTRGGDTRHETNVKQRKGVEVQETVLGEEPLEVIQRYSKILGVSEDALSCIIMIEPRAYIGVLDCIGLTACGGRPCLLILPAVLQSI